MKALLLAEYNTLQMTDVPTPEIGPDDVLIRVRACGICGSDVHGLDGSTGRRIPPLVMGHEAAGVVADVGDKVRGLAVDTRVTFDSTINCGQCYFCRRGELNLCDDRRVLGVSCNDYRQHGAFAEYVAVPQHAVYALPEGLPFEHAAMIEPVSVAVHAAARAAPRIGDTAVVVGSGMIGLLAIQALRAAGCTSIVAVDIDAARLQLAEVFDVDATLDATQCDVAAEVKKRTGGRGADVAVEAVGNGQALQTAIGAVRKGGTVALVGNIEARVELPLQDAVTRELTLAGSCASNGEYPTAIDLLNRRIIDVGPLISAVAPLDEGPAWFARLYQRESGLMKVVLQP